MSLTHSIGICTITRKKLACLFVACFVCCSSIVALEEYRIHKHDIPNKFGEMGDYEWIYTGRLMANNIQGFKEVSINGISSIDIYEYANNIYVAITPNSKQYILLLQTDQADFVKTERKVSFSPKGFLIKHDISLDNGMERMLPDLTMNKGELFGNIHFYSVSVDAHMSWSKEHDYLQNIFINKIETYSDIPVNMEFLEQRLESLAQSLRQSKNHINVEKYKNDISNINSIKEMIKKEEYVESSATIGQTLIQGRFVRKWKYGLDPL